ncbi:hypothetical protein EMCRGX_G021516 [Ephydatia muelleri]
MQGVLPLKPLSNQKSSQTVVDMFTDDGLLVGQVAKKGSTRSQVSVLSSWVEAWNILHSDCAQTALELVKYQHIISQLTTSGPVISTSSHHSTASELIPLYNERAHTTLRSVSSHHSMTSELTPLYDKRAHTTLRPASSHHSTNSELTPLYDQNSHHSMTSELTPLYDQHAHTTLRPVKLTPLYKQRAHTTLQTASSHHSTNSELTPLYNQNSHHSTTSELT